MTIEAKTGEGRSSGNEAMLDTAFLYGANAAYILGGGRCSTGSSFQ